MGRPRRRLGELREVAASLLAHLVKPGVFDQVVEALASGAKITAFNVVEFEYQIRGVFLVPGPAAQYQLEDFDCEVSFCFHKAFLRRPG
jgi:hypothetical protein